MSRGRVVVVGAGVGGLVAALDLAARGVEVLVLERAAAPGGKMREVEVGGAAIDAGPTVFTMRWVFDELFDAAGAALADHLTLQPLDVLARHAWRDDQRLDLYADRRPLGRRDRRLRRRRRGARLPRVLRARRSDLRHAGGAVPARLAAERRCRWRRAAGWRGLPGLLRISPFATLWNELGELFRRPAPAPAVRPLRHLLRLVAVPAPATLMLVAHVEQQRRVAVEGGMHRIAAGAGRAGRARRRARSASAPRSPRSCVAAAAPRRAAGRRRTHRGRRRGLQRRRGALAPGCSAPRVRARRSAHAAHPRSARCRRSPGTCWRRPPAFRCCATTSSSRATTPPSSTTLRARAGAGRADGLRLRAGPRRRDATAPPGGAERLLMHRQRAAAGDGRFHPRRLTRCERRPSNCWSAAACRCSAAGGDAADDADEFDRAVPGDGRGAVRPGVARLGGVVQPTGSRSRLPGLYLAGGSVHPGPGVPMAALSGRQAAASVLADRRPRGSPASTSRWRPAATPGGTSTR